MATRGSIPKMMEIAGIDMLPPEAGVPLIRRELTSGGTRGEILIGERLGVLLNEWDPTGGLDTTAREEHMHGPMVGKLAAAGVHNGLTIETTLDPKVQPFLQDHQIDGTPVLPGVIGIEAFAEAALCLLPGWHIDAIEDVNFAAPFKFYRGEPRAVITQAVVRSKSDALVADCRLIGRRQLPHQTEPQETTHFTGRIRLAREPVKADMAPALMTRAEQFVESRDIYRVYFHGPAYQVVERAWFDGKRVIGQLNLNLPPNHHPPELPTIVAPRLVELCFQTAGLWELGVQGRFGLPLHVDRVHLYQTPNPAARVYAVVTPDPDHSSFNAEVVDTAGNRYVQLVGYRTVAMANAVGAEALKVLQAALIAQPALV
jgi:hypothetical protein